MVQRAAQVVLGLGFRRIAPEQEGDVLPGSHPVTVQQQVDKQRLLAHRVKRDRRLITHRQMKFAQYSDIEIGHG